MVKLTCAVYVRTCAMCSSVWRKWHERRISFPIHATKTKRRTKSFAQFARVVCLCVCVYVFRTYLEINCNNVFLITYTAPIRVMSARDLLFRVCFSDETKNKIEI